MFSRALFRNVRVNRSLLAVPGKNAMRAMPKMTQFQSIRKYSDQHDEETFEEFTVRYEKEFDQAYDLFEVQRVLNNCFSYDLVPAPAVVEKALRAARRVNDLPTAIRVFEALKYKVENEEQYNAYLEELKDVRAELGIPLKEELFTN
ncbi:LANO_0H09956g1_1 [Lachancea nothofagi CBS 11611]|uniref:Cytochrome c oxidase subunit 6, mitochondrial n=1 Tax=Lachancea nothofagi CBS 11611 TaxID=1266666 RepID=A0A1G4KM22_9SACH|nr:LANO_0H09956g1_1 [Lachancea nothofagi CBS 11611]